MAARSLAQLVRERRSVRAYSGQAIPAAAFTELAAACGALTRGPLGTECRILLLSNVWSVWGTRHFLAGAVRSGPHALADLGRLLQELVLRACGFSLGTCWIGLGFPQAAFAEALALAPGEVLPAVIAVGVPSGRKTAYGLAARLATGASRRKSWGELFFDGDFHAPLSAPGGLSGPGGPPAGAGPHALALEMVRLAPSAQNRQPWRVVREGPEERSRYHFFRQQPAGLLPSRPDWLRLDIGIAMAHFELALAEAGVRGRWSADGLPSGTAPVLRLPPRTDYVASWLPGEGP
jgi:hypothetical protein